MTRKHTTNPANLTERKDIWWKKTELQAVKDAAEKAEMNTSEFIREVVLQAIKFRRSGL